MPDTAATLSPSARRVQDALAALGLDCAITEHAASARTSQEAADLLGFERVHAAGGTPNALFPIASADLLRVCGGRAADIKA